MNWKRGDKVFVIDNNFTYPAIVAETFDNDVIEVYKYALGLYSKIKVGKASIKNRDLNISVDIFTNRQNYLINRKEQKDEPN